MSRGTLDKVQSLKRSIQYAQYRIYDLAGEIDLLEADVVDWEYELDELRDAEGLED